MSGFRLDSLKEFWSVADQLENGQSVAEQTWDELFRTSGYQALATEFRPAVLRTRFELVFHPDRGDEARARAGQDWLVAHCLRVRAERHRIHAFIAGLDAAALLADALRCASGWLPPAVAEGAPLPPVALAVFDADARSYSSVVVDAGFALQLGETNLVLLLAHEFHHWFRSRSTAGSPISGGDLHWVLDQIQAEGIADLINVPAFLGEPGLPDGIWPGWADRYRHHLQQAPAFLTEMERLLQHMAVSPESAAEDARRLRALLPMAGHPVGYHMACRTVEAGLRDALISAHADPIHFFRLYVEACKRLGSACELTDRSLTYLESA